MRILHVLDHSLPLHSGYAFRTVAILREQRALGWETFHLTSPKQGPTALLEDDADGFRFYRTPLTDADRRAPPVLRELKLMAALKRRLMALATELRPDILHAHSPALNALPAIAVGKRLGIPVVYEVRAFWEDAAVDHGTSEEGGLRYRATRALETRALRGADHVTTICEGLRQDIVARGIATERVTVIPNAVDAQRFAFGAPVDEALRRQLGLDGKSVIGFIGSFYAYEGLDLLIDALPAILDVRPEARVLLVGGGPQEPALRAQAARLGVDGKVVFTGRVPHHAVHRYYSVVDVLAYPRRSMRLTELVTPLKPLEAMAQGHLLVASDVGGHRELIRHNETGMLCRAGDSQALAGAILELLAHRVRWPQLRERGRGFVERERTWKRSVARYRDVYRTLQPEMAT